MRKLSTTRTFMMSVVSPLLGAAVATGCAVGDSELDPASDSLTTSGDVVLEGESMSLPSSAGAAFADSSASGGRGLLMWSNSRATATVTTGAVNRLVVRARGDQCAGAPNMTVKVDGVTVLTAAVSSGLWTDYSAPLPAGAGSHTVEVGYDNDLVTSCDRNLRVDKLTFVAATQPASRLEGEAMSLPAGNGIVVGDGAASGGKALLIWSNATASGTLATTGAKRLVVRARGDQCNGAPRMLVRVDGVERLATDVATTAWTDYAFDIALADGAHKIDVQFPNDYATGCDRNLFVDYVAVAAGVAQPPPPPPPPPPATTPVGANGQLAVSGNRIVNSFAQPVQFRGMSFGWSNWWGQYYTPQVVSWLRDDWKVEVVRAAMGIEPGGAYLDSPAAEKAKVKAVVDEAIKRGLYVVIDWHDHNAPQHVAQAKAFFTEMATTYGNTPNVMYEIFNEPDGETWPEIKTYANTIISAIRAVDPDNIIIVGTPTWSQDVDVAAKSPLVGTNLAYTLHFYAATHKQYLRDKATAALQAGLALVVTEWGVCEASGTGYFDQAETNLWLKFMDANKLSWMNWDIADKAGETCSALQPGVSTTGNWTTQQLTGSGVFLRQTLRGYAGVGP
jgi:endoglucanase